MWGKSIQVVAFQIVDYSTKYKPLKKAFYSCLEIINSNFLNACPVLMDCFTDGWHGPDGPSC